MKLKLYHILPFLLFALFSSAAMAQDGSYSESMEPEVKSSYLPGGESQKFEAKDSMYFRPAPQVKIQESQKNSTDVKNEAQDDDVLSFNFLYYIIQKFKMSDIVDP
jgi:hypothetical protein